MVSPVFCVGARSLGAKQQLAAAALAAEVLDEPAAEVLPWMVQNG
jgi:hypothetical protein